MSTRSSAACWPDRIRDRRPSQDRHIGSSADPVRPACQSAAELPWMLRQLETTCGSDVTTGVAGEDSGSTLCNLTHSAVAAAVTVTRRSPSGRSPPALSLMRPPTMPCAKYADSEWCGSSTVRAQEVGRSGTHPPDDRGRCLAQRGGERRGQRGAGLGTTAAEWRSLTRSGPDEHVWVTVMAPGSRYVLVWKARYAAT